MSALSVTGWSSMTGGSRAIRNHYTSGIHRSLTASVYINKL